MSLLLQMQAYQLQTAFSFYQNAGQQVTSYEQENGGTKRRVKKQNLG